jgi:hypothetical protein
VPQINVLAVLVNPPVRHGKSCKICHSVDIVGRDLVIVPRRIWVGVESDFSYCTGTARHENLHGREDTGQRKG